MHVFVRLENFIFFFWFIVIQIYCHSFLPSISIAWSNTNEPNYLCWIKMEIFLVWTESSNFFLYWYWNEGGMMWWCRQMTKSITSFYLLFNDYFSLFYEICNANFQFVVHLFPTSFYYPIATNRLIYSNKEKCTGHGPNVVVCKTINQLRVRHFISYAKRTQMDH